MTTMRRLWKNYNLSIVLAILFIGSWVGQACFQWREFAAEQREHNQPVEVGGYVDQFLSSTLENWQSEFLQLLSFVILTSILVHRGSHESKDSDERLEAKVDAIARRLDDLLDEPRDRSSPARPSARP